MDSWSELLAEFNKHQNDPNWLDKKLKTQLEEISRLRSSRTVIFYASSFLQKPGVRSSIDREDVNGFMISLQGVDSSNGLTLILHTPGGDADAVESIVEYLHSKFTYIETVVPYLAMSGGAMISLASDLLLMGKQSQLGPIDPQLITANKTHSARAILDGFNRAKRDIGNNTNLAHLWAPILQNMGPSLIVEADKALSYSKELVMKWLNKRSLLMNVSEQEKGAKVDEIAAYFNAETKENGSTTENGPIHVHGQRIGLEKLQSLGLKVERFEDGQVLQDAILTAYHLMTLVFEKTLFNKFITNNYGKMWAKQYAPPATHD